MNTLMQKYLRGEATEQERMKLLSRLRADEEIGEWLRADMEFSDSRMPQPVQDRILRNIMGEHQSASSRQERPFRFWLAACCTAIVVLCGVCGYLLWSNHNLSTDREMLNSDVIIHTDLGEHSHVTLPDGTEVTLNAQTTVRYATAMTDGKRRVQVDGEAFFRVAKDAEHPFIVTSGDVDVTCLGTSFDVRHYADDNSVAVVLAEGKVRVSAYDAEMTMEPDSRVVYDCDAKTLSKQSVPSTDYTCWLSGEVKYNNQTLEQIASELSRNYNIRLVITSDELKQERFTGYLGRASLRNILDVMCLAANMNYHIADDTVVYVYARK
ncbi:MAG: FecR domain-containing protein [Paludibacteraceae bacterium]|nr:FecR domain-containing protein [Paludibacteraceae bacterium]